MSAPDPDVETVLAMAAELPPRAFRAWIDEQRAGHEAARRAECDANGSHLTLESGSAYCGHCDRRLDDGPGDRPVSAPEEPAR